MKGCTWNSKATCSTSSITGTCWVSAENILATSLVNPTRASRFSGDPQTDWGKLMNGYNYIDAMNGAGAFAGGVQSKLTLSSQYGMPNSFQNGRAIRLAMRFVF